MTHQPTIVVISGGAGHLSAFSSKLGDAIAMALRTYFSHVEHLEFDATLEKRLEAMRPEAVFPVIGDAGLTKLLESLGLHFVGSGADTNCLLQVKRHMKALLYSVGVPVEDSVICTAHDDIAEVAGKAMEAFPGGCLVGSHESFETGLPELCKSEISIAAALEQWLARNDEVVIERRHSTGWREISVAVVEPEGFPPRVLPIVEIIYSDLLQAMYSPSDVEYRCPASLPKEITAKSQRYALEAYRVLGLKDFARMDMIVDDKGEIFVQEVHAIPQLSDRSLFMRSSKAAGISIEDLAITMVRRTLCRSCSEIKNSSR